jgi:hypothetical protein
LASAIMARSLNTAKMTISSVGKYLRRVGVNTRQWEQKLSNCQYLQLSQASISHSRKLSLIALFSNPPATSLLHLSVPVYGLGTTSHTSCKSQSAAQR